MAYVKTNWKNLPSTDTPIIDTALDNMENGIEYNDQRLNGTKPMESIVVDDVNGKNLFDKSKVINAYLSAGNGQPVTNADHRVSDYINIDGANYLIVSGSAGSGVVSCFYNSSKVYLNSSFSMASSETTKTVQVPANAKYIRVTIHNSALDTYQLEKGNALTDTATTYTPYNQPVKKTSIGVKENNTFYADDFKCRNLAELDDFTQTASQSSTYKTVGKVYLDAGTYTLSWTQSASMTSNARNTPGYEMGNTRVFQSQNTNYNMNAGRSSWTFTITTAGTYTFIWWINTPSTTVNMTDFMLEVGSEMTNYTPHKNIGGDTGWVSLNSTHGVWYRYKNSVVAIKIGDYSSNTINSLSSLSLGNLPPKLKPQFSITGSCHIKSSSNGYVNSQVLFRVYDTGEVVLQNWVNSNVSFSACEGTIVYII